MLKSLQGKREKGPPGWAENWTVFSCGSSRRKTGFPCLESLALQEEHSKKHIEACIIALKFTNENEKRASAWSCMERNLEREEFASKGSTLNVPGKESRFSGKVGGGLFRDRNQHEQRPRGGKDQKECE